MLLDENPLIELTDVDATNLVRLLYASARKAVGEKIVPATDNRKQYYTKAQKVWQFLFQLKVIFGNYSSPDNRDALNAHCVTFWFMHASHENNQSLYLNLVFLLQGIAQVDLLGSGTNKVENQN